MLQQDVSVGYGYIQQEVENIFVEFSTLCPALVVPLQQCAETLMETKKI